MPRFPSRLAATFLAGFLGLSSVLAAGRLPFRHYQTEDGLPQTQVLSLLEDSRGELWVGTWSGAARFDGLQFRSLSLRSGLPSSFIFDIVEDADNNLWFAAGSGLARLEADQRQRVTTVAYPLFPNPDTSSVRDLLIDRNGVLWAAALLGGVAYLDGETPVRVAAPELDNDALQVFAETAEGELLLGTLEGIFAVERDASRRWNTSAGPWNLPITMVFAAPDGSLLFSTTESLWRWNGERATEITYRRQPIGASRSAAIDSHGSLWIATDAGLYRRTGSGETVRLGLAQGLRHEDRFYSILEDREGNVWFGSDGGLTLFPGDLFRIYLRDDGLRNESVWSLGLDADGSLLAGTSEGVFRFQDQRFAPLPEPNPLHDQMVRAIVADLDGRLWFGTRNNGLFLRDGASWRHLLPPEFPAYRIYGMICDPQGAVWIATRRGLARYVGDELDFWDHSDGLPNDVVLRVGLDPRGRTVVATAGGLVRLENGRFVIPPEFQLLAGVAVRAFVYGRDGTLWVGTDGRGLYRKSGEDWRVLLAEESHSGRARGGPSNDFTWGLIEDAQGRIWLATNLGLDLFTGERWINFSKRDGLIQDEISAFAALATPDGAAWFGFSNSGGLVRFPAEPLAAELPPPLVKITAVKTASRELLEKPFALALPWHERDVTFSYIGISFRDARSMTYRTMLEGYDSDFGPPGGDTSVRYTNLAPGTYRFHVEAAGVDGRWTAAAEGVELRIAAPFWRNSSFVAVCLLTAGSLVFTVYRIRVRRVEKKATELEARVAERTRELVAEKQKVEDALAEVKTLSGLLPICSSCKKVRDDHGYWERIEIYIRDRSEAEFTHGLCPDCVDTYFAKNRAHAADPG